MSGSGFWKVFAQPFEEEAVVGYRLHVRSAGIDRLRLDGQQNLLNGHDSHLAPSPRSLWGLPPRIAYAQGVYKRSHVDAMF